MTSRAAEPIMTHGQGHADSAFTATLRAYRRASEARSAIIYDTRQRAAADLLDHGVVVGGLRVPVNVRPLALDESEWHLTRSAGAPDRLHRWWATCDLEAEERGGSWRWSAVWDGDRSVSAAGDAGPDLLDALTAAERAAVALLDRSADEVRTRHLAVVAADAGRRAAAAAEALRVHVHDLIRDTAGMHPALGDAAHWAGITNYQAQRIADGRPLL